MRSQSTTTPRHAYALKGLLLVLGAVLVSLALTGPAAAKTTCGQKVLADWFDNGRIDRIYDLHCYEDAIDIIPEDIRVYADAEEVITRALQGALEGKLVTGGNDPTPGNGSDSGNGGSGGSGGSGNDGGPGGETPPGDPTAAPDVDTSGPSSVPIPLLVLGGLSLALLGAGGLGYLSRRRTAAEGVEPDDDFLAG